MAVVELHRTRDRQGLTVPVRIALLEQDADTSEHEHGEVALQLGKLNARLFGVLIALVAALFALCGNLIVLVVK